MSGVVCCGQVGGINWSGDVTRGYCGDSDRKVDIAELSVWRSGLNTRVRERAKLHGNTKALYSHVYT